MSTIYSTKVTAFGGRNGTVRSEDGLLDMKLSLPISMGGKGDAPNPEQLFAAGYAACFANAVIHASRTKPVKLTDDDIKIVAEVGLASNGSGGFSLSIALDVAISVYAQETAEETVRAAHAICPYSNATRGNIDVRFTVTGRQ